MMTSAEYQGDRTVTVGASQAIAPGRGRYGSTSHTAASAAPLPSSERNRQNVALEDPGQAEIRTSEGKTIAEAVRELGISEQTYYRWRKQYGGMEVNQARRLKELEQENGRLKRLVADQALDLSIHKEVSRGNF
jgi:hypothetical protein